MIDPKAITTYAQYNEDIILLALLGDVANGFYVDAGANYPTIDSVTKLFYDKGWHGINVEPLKKLYEQLVEERPRDLNLNIGLSDSIGSAVFREYKTLPGHSTFDIQQKKHDKTDKYIDYEVPIRPLRDILGEQNVDRIDFLKVDVEGYEYEVIAGNDWERFKPIIVCIEASHRSQDWRPILIGHGYKLFIADGLNEYYIAKEHWDKTNGYDERIVTLDYHALKQHQQQSWAADSEELTHLHSVVRDQQAQLDAERRETAALSELSELSLKEQPWWSRLVRAFNGLTTDWYEYHKNTTKKRP